MSTRFIEKFSRLAQIQNLVGGAGIGWFGGRPYVNGAGSAVPLQIERLNGNIWFVATDGSNSSPNDGKSWDTAWLTITKAISSAAAGDTILVGPGAYDETVSIGTTKGPLTIIGIGGRGAVYIEPTTAGAEGMQVLGNDVTLVNLGVAGHDTGDYALNVQGSRPGGTGTKYGKRFRAYGCKFELADGAGPAVLLNGTADYQASDALFEDCEFAYAGYGLRFDDSGYGYPTQIFLENCRFHNIATEHIGLATGGGVTNLHVTNCVFDNKEDGTAPTNYIKVNRSGDTGIVSGCRFALATNSNKNVVAAGVLWSANATEAGWSTARPTGS